MCVKVPNPERELHHACPACLCCASGRACIPGHLKPWRTMGVHVSISRRQWPSVVSGATTRKGPGLPSSWRWNSSVAMDCAVLPRPCASRRTWLVVSADFHC